MSDELRTCGKCSNTFGGYGNICPKCGAPVPEEAEGSSLDNVFNRDIRRGMPSLITGDFAEREGIVSEFVRSEVAADARKRFWLRDEIPLRAFQNALRIWAPGIAREDVLLFWDVSPWDIANWSSGKYGLLLTNTNVYVRYFDGGGVTIIDLVRLDEIWATGSTCTLSTVPFHPDNHCVTVNDYRFFRPSTPSASSTNACERTGKMVEKVAGLLSRVVRPRPPGPNLGERIEGLTDDNFFQRLADCEARGRIPVIEFSWSGSYDRGHLLLFTYFRYASRFALGVMETSTHNRIVEQLGINTRPLVCVFRHGRVIRVIRSASYTPPDSHRRYIDHGSVRRALEAVITAYANITTDSDLRAVTERLAEKVSRRRSGINLVYDIGGAAGVVISFIGGIGVMVLVTLLLHSCR